MTSLWLENNLGKMSWVAITAIVNIMPNIVDVTTATITANFAVLGLLAPSSFETRTLSKYPTCMSNFVTKISVCYFYNFARCTNVTLLQH